MAVPLGAVVRAAGTSGYAVFVIEDKGDAPVARLRGVGLGPMLGNEVTVTAGLSAGERVITNGATIVTDGERVSLIP
jgi:multidrug efflux pump subunit AcrA (membrane-fusion protein)